MDRRDLDWMRDALSESLKKHEQAVADLDRMIARIDELIEEQDARVEQRAQIRDLAAARRELRRAESAS